MRLRRIPIAALFTLFVLWAAGCPKPQVVKPPPPPERVAPPPVRVPPGCEAPKVGLYRHSENASFQYRAEDDGGLLLLHVERPNEDGGFASEDGGATIALNRTPNGFVGSVDAIVFTPHGSACHVAFPTEVTGCPDGGLVLRSAVSASVDETCQLPKKSAPAPRLEHLLVRVDQSAVHLIEPDAGEEDAGASTDAGFSSAEDAGEDAGAK